MLRFGLGKAMLGTVGATGVYDWESGKAGTLEIPISPVAIAAPSTAAIAPPQNH